MNPQMLVLSGVADVRDRFLRAVAGLDIASESADAGTRAVLMAYRQEVKDRLSEQMRLIAEHLEGIRAGFGDDPVGWDPAELSDLSDATVRSFDLLSLSHYDVATHLPGMTRAREDLRYMLMRSVNFSLMSHEHTKLLSVQDSPYLVWAASRFTELQGDNPTAAAVAIPWLETHTPLRWPLAVHELGHIFLPGGDAEPVRPRVLEVAQSNGWRNNDLTSFQEIVADAVAQRAVGDAYAYALAREGYLLSHETHLAGGVSVEQRLRLLGGPAELLDNLPAAWDLDRRSPRGEPQAPETPPQDRNAMREAALDMVGDTPVNDPGAIDLARQLIRANEPPAAVHAGLNQDPDSLRQLADALADREAAPMSREAIKQVIGLAVHRSLTDGEILEAAWREDCERDVDALLHTFNETLTDDIIEEESRVVATRDTWLAQALQSAAVHRWLETSADLVEAM